MPLTPGEILYAVVFIHLASVGADPGPVVNNQIRSTQCSMDPFANYVPSAGNKVWDDVVTGNPALEQRENTLGTTQLYDPPNGSSTAEFTPDFAFERQDIAFYLGFDNPILAQYDSILGIARGKGARLQINPDITLTDPLTNNQ